MRALYVSHNGMAENLGQSQVLPYLRGLARRGVQFDLVSYELATVSPERHAELATELARDGIRWHPLLRTVGGSLGRKLSEARSGVLTALRAALARRPEIVHGRSYLPSAICDAVGQVSRRSKLLFDCRGMIGDEYVDCGHWTTDRLEYRMVKAYERRLFRDSDGVVVLTRALASWLRDNRLLGPRPELEVVPCCVDTRRFRPSEESRAAVRQELGIGDRLAVAYSGSLGTWYREHDMARMAMAVRERSRALGRETVFVCFTGSDPSNLRSRLSEVGFPDGDVVVRAIAPKQMPRYLSGVDVGLSLIQSCFSKKGSSPTKVAEYLACGNVVAINGDIGDQADLADEHESCVVLDGFGDAEIQRAATKLVSLVVERPRETSVAAAQGTARRHFDLERVGVARYARLYEALAFR